MKIFYSLFIASCWFLFIIKNVHASSHRIIGETKANECANPNANACLFVTCENGGQCIEDPTTPDCFKCHCLPGFIGKICGTSTSTLPIGCNPGCENGGVCNLNVCTCLAGFTGILCETKDNCSPTNPCQNGGRCSSTINSYLCDCDGTSFTGAICTELITTNPCTSSPCQNGAQCSWNGLTMSCSCIGGYTGTFCQVSPVPCAATPCENGGKCELIDGNTYGCVCPEQFAGTRCETYMLTNHPCVTMAAEVCRNGGVCTVDGNDYLCNCAPGWSGRNCEVRETPSLCNSNPCANQGSCFQVQLPVGPGIHCICKAGWTGNHCDVTTTEDCFDGYCSSYGVCRMNGNIRYCECHPLYTGIRCETFIGAATNTTTTTSSTVVFITTTSTTSSSTISANTTTCRSNPCLNGGLCHANGNLLTCICKIPFTGILCDTTMPTTAPLFTTTGNALTCTNNPCQNGGTCVPVSSSYFCFCGLNSVYTGKNCDSTTPMSFTECPLNCAPGRCIFSGYAERPHACLWNGIMRPDGGTTR
ncbi:hypothetical protein I4U23_010125 [Adineta vaga]|nr:hypothetical protein I4U23_010125 [Adineta vaga]